MMFKAAALASMAFAGASASIVPGEFSANTRAGHRLLSKASVVEERGLANNERDTTWIAGYSIKYEGCSSLIQVAGERGGEEESQLYTQNLVKFSLCPSDSSCDKCKGGASYVVNMNDFIDAYTEMKMTQQEQACENIREYCYCDNANDDEACENQCYQQAGMSECIEVEGEEEFDAQRYLECSELEGGNDNGNQNYNYNNGGNNNVNYYQQYFVGAYCSPKDGKSIHLGVFHDAGCSSRATNGSEIYAARNYGAELPFYSSSMVKSECISCLQVDENNNNNGNNNNNQNYEMIELCEQSYEQAARCEANLSPNSQYFYPDTSGCTYINTILPRLESATTSVNKKMTTGKDGSGTSTTFAVLFGISTVILGAYSFFLYRKIHRAKVNLSQSEGAMA